MKTTAIDCKDDEQLSAALLSDHTAARDAPALKAAASLQAACNTTASSY
jgi:hypothetical protein